MVYTTNAIESINARIRKAVKARGHFPTETAALKCVYLALMSLDPTGRDRQRWMNRWKPALNAVRPSSPRSLNCSNRLSARSMSHVIPWENLNLNIDGCRSAAARSCGATASGSAEFAGGEPAGLIRRSHIEEALHSAPSAGVTFGVRLPRRLDDSAEQVVVGQQFTGHFHHRTTHLFTLNGLKKTCAY